MTAESIKDSFKMLQMTEKETIQILLEEDILVPDIKPDLSKIVSIDGKIKIIDKEAINSGTRLTGKIDLKVMYVPVSNTEEFPLVPMDALVGFKHELDYLVSDKSDTEIIGNLEHVDYEIVNERKLRVKAVANISTKAYKAVNVDLFTSTTEDEMQLLKKEIKYTDIIERKKAPIEIKEELSIKEGMPEIGKILNWDINVVENQKQIVNDRAVINATIQYNVLYLSEDVEPVPVLFRESSEFTQFIDIKEIEGALDSKVEFSLNDSNIIVKNDIEENATVLEASVDILTNIEVSKTAEKEIIVDAYHPSREIDIEKDVVEYKLMSGRSVAEIPVKEIVSIPDSFPDSDKVVSISAKVVEMGNSIESDRDIVEGILSVSVLYLSNEDQRKVYGFEEEIPFRHAVEIQGLTSNKEIERDIALRKIDFEQINGKQIEINAEIYMKSTAYIKESFEALTNVNILDTIVSVEDSPSIIVYVTKKDDNLWTIAKKYRTTIEEIRSINELSEEDDIMPGEKLLLLKNCQ